ncbi:MAG: hypothetical protein JWL69_864 [Phycisphaerales bacterium]|jgi:polyhydroxyalkanoate synthesis regulator phasin|nr:hypothetical protein [Phycisphaerales bacterium]MDB5357526.1 hypothetical protein [Phycisphaerales bacterium]
MKPVVMKSIYTGLGLLSTGKETIEEIARKLAKRANLSEKDGEKIARHLRARSEKAVKSLQKSLETEVKKVVGALHAVTGEHKSRASGAKRKAAGKSAAKRRASHKPKAASTATH